MPNLYLYSFLRWQLKPDVGWMLNILIDCRYIWSLTLKLYLGYLFVFRYLKVFHNTTNRIWFESNLDNFDIPEDLIIVIIYGKLFLLNLLIWKQVQTISTAYRYVEKRDEPWIDMSHLWHWQTWHVSNGEIGDPAKRG